jgi:hypothetical protein
VWIAASGRVYAARIEDAGLGEPVEIGPFTTRPTHIHAFCSLQDGTRVVQFLSDAGRNLVFLKAGVWSAPRVEAGISGDYACAGDTVSMAWATWPKGGERSIHRATCTVDACRRGEVPLPAPAGDRKFSYVLPVGDRVLVALSHPDDGGLRYRLGELGQLAAAPEVIVHDDKKYGGPMILKPTLHPLGGRALLLYESLGGLHALEIRADGEWRPVAPATD